MKKPTKTNAKKTTKTPAPKATKEYPAYKGAPIACTPGQCFKRDMPEFKNCVAESWLMIDEVGQKYTFANVYQGRLKSSYDPSKYQYNLNDKALGKLLTKIEHQGYAEVEPTEWPEWITPAMKPIEARPATRRGRKAIAR